MILTAGSDVLSHGDALADFEQGPEDTYWVLWPEHSREMDRYGPAGRLVRAPRLLSRLAG
jgi:hypothetical protein